MRQQKILYVADAHPAVTPGSAATRAFEVFTAMRERGAFQPVLLARAGAPNVCKPGTRVSEAEGDPAQYFFYTDANEIDEFSLAAREKHIAIEDYRKFLEAQRPALVHFQHTVHLGFELIRETRNVLGQVPIVYTFDDYLPICSNGGRLVRSRTGERCLVASPMRCHQCLPQRSPVDFFLRKRLIESHLGLVDLFLAPGHFLRQRYIDWGIPPEKIHVQDYGRPPVARRAEVPRRRTRIGYFGESDVMSGVDVLLRAMQILAEDRDCPAHLWVHGPNRPVAKAANTTVVARYARDEISRLMADIDWVVVPSIWWESSPLVIQEAFQHGRPVICSDIGGMAERVADGVDGLHFRAGDEHRLAETIRRAVETEGLWDRLVAGIPAVYRIEDAIDELGSLYSGLLAAKAGTLLPPIDVKAPPVAAENTGQGATLEALEPAAFKALD